TARFDYVLNRCALTNEAFRRTRRTALEKELEIAMKGELDCKVHSRVGGRRDRWARRKRMVTDGPAVHPYQIVLRPSLRSKRIQMLSRAAGPSICRDQTVRLRRSNNRSANVVARLRYPR